MITNEEWLKQRLDGIGGSEASIILGVNPYKSRLELWNEKVTGNLTIKDNPDLYWGKILEPVILEEYKKKTGRPTLIHKEQIKSTIYPFMNANLDAIITKADNHEGAGVLEIKTKSAFTYWKDDEIPFYYQLQLQHYLSVMGFSWGAFAVLDMGKKDLIIKDFERDDDVISELIEEESKFWKLVQDKIPPEIQGGEACGKYLKNIYPSEIPDKVIDLKDNLSATHWTILLKPIKEELKFLKGKEQECKNNLMAIMQDAQIGLGDGYKITWKCDADSISFDIDKFKLEHPELYTMYSKSEKGSRRFTVRFNKE